MFELLGTVEGWLAQNRSIALATVTRTWGSAPRREGAKMAVTDEMAMVGSVSGGCIEGTVIEEAVTILKTRQARLLHFGVADETAWGVGLTCGGNVDVFVEPLDYSWWQTLQSVVDNNELAISVTALSGSLTGEKLLLNSSGVVQYATTRLSTEMTRQLCTAAQHAQQSQQKTLDDQTVFIDVVAPKPHLILIGGVHVAVPLQVIARQAGFRVSIVDPRKAFATQERFPDVETILYNYPDKALLQLGLDQNTYLAVLTHDPKIDDKALLTALPAHIPYVGVLSSRRTHHKRVQRLQEAGLSDALIAQIRTPIGLNIGGRKPEEIAVAIMAEIIAVRNGIDMHVSSLAT